MPIKTESREILKTLELCKVEYETGGWMKLMCQTYSDSSVFYWVTESHLCYDMSVDSADEILRHIIDYMERRFKGYANILDGLRQDQIEVINIYKNHIEVTKLFIDKIKEAEHRVM